MRPNIYQYKKQWCHGNLHGHWAISVQGGTIEEQYLADEHYRYETPNTIFTDFNTTADINENNVIHKHSRGQQYFIYQTDFKTFEHDNINVEQKVDEVSGEITRLTKDNKRLRILFCTSKEMIAILLPLMHSSIIPIGTQLMIKNCSFTFNQQSKVKD